MQSKIETLIAIQAIDSEIMRLESTAARLPEELNECLAAYNEIENDAVKVKKEIEDNQKKCREKEREIAAANDASAKLNGKLNGVKTNKEYAAILTEIDSIKNKIVQLEDKELSLMESQELLKVSCKEKELLLNTEKDKLEAKKKENQLRLADVEAMLKEVSGKREKMAESLDEELYKDYTKIGNLRDGQAVVGLRGGVCEGCFQRLTPQVVVEAKKSDTVTHCPHCSRLLCWKEIERG